MSAPRPLAVLRHALPVGTVLHGYELIGVLGAGGFGVTYLARDLKLDSLRAIKEFYPRDLVEREADRSVSVRSEDDRPDYEAGLRSFLGEARIGASLDHPHIARVLAFFEAHGTGYAVMPYYEGSTLQQRLQQASGGMPREEILELLLPILDALEYLHGRGLIHRDIKPANIYLRSVGGPLLIDFGAARLASRGTRPLTAILTPGYAPPEQYLPDAPQGAFTDLYAVGAVLYRMISGLEPQDAYSRSVGGMQGDPLVPASRLAQGRYGHAFLAAVDRCLRMSPTARFATVAELREALLRTHDPLPVDAATQPPPALPPAPAVTAAAPATLPPPAARPAPSVPPRRSSTAPLLAGGVLLAAALGLAAWRFGPWSGPPAPDAPAVAAAPPASVVPPPGGTFRDPLASGGSGPELVVLPAGRFDMGSIELALDRKASEGPQHEVAIRSFALGRFELSNEEFRRFVSATGYQTDAERDRRASRGSSGSSTQGCMVALIGGFDWLRNTAWNQPMRPLLERQPVVCVSHDDAAAYLDWLARETGQPYRLPSEAEFEYALRNSPRSDPFPWHEQDQELFCQHGNLDSTQTGGWIEGSCDDRQQGVASIGSFQPNGYGLHDLFGNVAEWTGDCWNASYAGAPADGSAWTGGDCEQRVLRGASWHDGVIDARVAARASALAGHRSVLVGFRVARDVTTTP